MRIGNRLLICATVALIFVQNLRAESGERYALLVGVNVYGSNSRLKELKYAASDMDSLAMTLRGLGFKPQNIFLMTQTGNRDPRFIPMKANVERELKLMLDDRGKDDFVVVAFAGHGLQYRGKEDVYFCPADARVGDDKTWLNMNKVMGQLKSCAAGHKLLIADCCRNDPRTEGLRDMGDNVESVTRPEKLVQQSVAALFSCGNGEFAHEEDEFKAGVFTHFLVEGLKGAAAPKGDVDLLGLAQYLQREVNDYVKKKYGDKQKPAFRMDDELGLVFGKFNPAYEKIAAGRAAMDKKDWRGAAAIFEDLYKADPKNDALKNDLSEAERKLGLSLCWRDGGNDEQEAARLFRKGAERGYGPSQCLLAAKYLAGTGVARDTAKALELFKLAAAQDCAHAQRFLGDMYENGEGVAKDSKEAEKHYKEALRLYAAELSRNDAEVQYGLAYMQINGQAPRNDKESMRLLRLSAAQGSYSAMTLVGWMYANARGVPKDEEEAVKWYRRAAEKNHPQARFFLAEAYESGHGVAQDEAEAAKWYRLAAEQSYPRAQIALAHLYQRGAGVEKNPAEGLNWIRKAAELGNSGAQIEAGRAYQTGNGTARNDAEAAKWYRKAADQNNTAGEVWLASMYENGRGVAKDEVEAVKWYRKAAEQGDFPAQTNLARMYENGLGGLPVDIDTAIEWYRKAAKLGGKTAAARLKELGKEE
ncbi:MAG TPA: caspase family protein [Planctomycetota bacterium]|nr:caspase family protein [Planctomycetota bacterium]